MTDILSIDISIGLHFASKASFRNADNRNVNEPVCMLNDSTVFGFVTLNVRQRFVAARSLYGFMLSPCFSCRTIKKLYGELSPL